MVLWNNKEKNKFDFDNDIKPLLEEKNGYVHTLTIRNANTLTIGGVLEDNKIDTLEKYNYNVNLILTKLQDLGYEIIDVKLNSQFNSGVNYKMDLFHTLIIYK